MRRLITLLLAVSLSCMGCGTVVNCVTEDELKPYGGVAWDLSTAAALVESTGSSSSFAGDGKGGAVFALLFVTFPFLDMPLSLMGDTLTLGLLKALETVEGKSP